MTRLPFPAQVRPSCSIHGKDGRTGSARTRRDFPSCTLRKEAGGLPPFLPALLRDRQSREAALTKSSLLWGREDQRVRLRPSLRSHGMERSTLSVFQHTPRLWMSRYCMPWQWGGHPVSVPDTVALLLAIFSSVISSLSFSTTPSICFWSQCIIQVRITGKVIRFHSNTKSGDELKLFETKRIYCSDISGLSVRSLPDRVFDVERILQQIEIEGDSETLGVRSCNQAHHMLLL